MKSPHAGNFANNFDCLRLVAAFLVFASHAFSIYGRHEPALLTSDSGFTAITPGTLGASMFFAISGYLITQSWVNTGQLLPFLKKRALRIYPAILVNFLVVSLLIAPLVSTMGAGDYFPAVFRQWPALALGGLIFKMPDLPDVFAANPIPHAVNIPLWTLIFETLCYLVIAACGILADMKKALPCLSAVYIVCFFNSLFFPHFDSDLGLIHCATFLLGACFFLYEKQSDTIMRWL